MESTKYFNDSVKILVDRFDGHSINVDNLKEENREHYSKLPRKLYKYSTINSYTIDVIENSYLYLCPATKLDDQFEAIIKAIDEKIISKSEDELKVAFMVKWLEKANKKRKSKELSSVLYKLKNPEITIDDKIRFMNARIDEFNQNKDYKKISDDLENGEFEKETRSLIDNLLGFRERIGICSLTAEKDNQVMWDLYGNRYQGCMIEYDVKTMPNETIAMLLPVLYRSKRKENVLDLYLDLLFEILSGEDQRALFRRFGSRVFMQACIKNLEWEFQKEWRVLGNSDSRALAPRISALYLGKKVDENNKNEIVQIAKAKKIKVFLQSDNYQTIGFDYTEL